RGAARSEPLALVVDRRRAHAGLHQLEPPPVDHLVIPVHRHGDGPPEVVRDPHSHGPDHGADGAWRAWNQASSQAVTRGAVPDRSRSSSLPGPAHWRIWASPIVVASRCISVYDRTGVRLLHPPARAARRRAGAGV